MSAIKPISHIQAAATKAATTVSQEQLAQTDAVSVDVAPSLDSEEQASSVTAVAAKKIIEIGEATVAAAGALDPAMVAKLLED